MSPPNYANAMEIVKSLISKGYLDDNSCLTQLGEDILYPNSKDNGEQEFLEIFRHLKMTKDMPLSELSIGSLSRKYLSPPNRKRINEILESLFNKGYLDSNRALTKKGEEAIYK